MDEVKSKPVRATAGAVLIALLSACDAEIGRTQTNPVISIVDMSCTYYSSGYCLDCGISFDGKFDCAARMKPKCARPSSQMVELQQYKVTVSFESGRQETYSRREVLREITECR